MAKWPRAHETHPPVEMEFDLEGVCHTYPGAEGVAFVDNHRIWPPTSRWPISTVRLGGHHTWYVGGHEPEDVMDYAPGDPNYGRGDRLDE
jgi:hypothetical protein